MKPDPPSLAIAAALGSAASWALGAVLFKQIAGLMAPKAVNFVKSIVSAVLLAVACLLMGVEKMDTTSWIWIAASGILGVAIGDTLFFKALVNLSPVSLLTLMMAGQVITILLALLFLKEIPSTEEWCAIAMISAGILLVLSKDLRGARHTQGWRGLLLGLSSILCMAISMVVIKGPLEEIGSLQTTGVRMAAGSLAMLGVGLCCGKLREWMAPLQNLSVCFTLFAGILVVTFGGFWLSIYAVKHLDLGLANSLNSTEPIFALPLAWLFLGERPDWRSLLGVGCVCAGICLIFI